MCFVVTLAIILSVASCSTGHRSTIAAVCRQVHPDGKGGVNPLLRNSKMFACFDDFKTCESSRTAVPGNNSDACVVSTPDWHCFSMHNPKQPAAPLDNIQTCFVSKAMCDAARPTFGEDTQTVVSDCNLTKTVSCSVGSEGQLTCFADQSSCESTKRFMVSVLPDDYVSQKCEQRTSASAVN
jgi:hypothetical protein